MKDKLEEWHDQIKDYNKLSFDEARDKYLEAISTKDLDERKAKIDEIVLGTLYVVYDYLVKNEIDVFSSSSYDIDDFINSFNELWIIKINEGILLKVNGFSKIINQTFISEVYRKNFDDNFVVSDLVIGGRELVINLFLDYIHRKNNGLEYDFNSLVENLPYYSPRLRFDYDRLLVLLENMYNNLNADNYDVIKTTKNKISFFIKFIVSNGLFESLDEEYSIDDENEKSIQDVDFKEVMSLCCERLDGTRYADVIYDRFGLFDDIPKNLETVAKRQNVSRERVRQIEAKGLRLLRVKFNHKFNDYI